MFVIRGGFGEGILPRPRPSSVNAGKVTDMSITSVMNINRCRSAGNVCHFSCIEMMVSIFPG